MLTTIRLYPQSRSGFFYRQLGTTFSNVLFCHEGLSSGPEHDDDVSNGHRREEEESAAKIPDQVGAIVKVGVVDQLGPKV